jgi:deoxyribodipyrimidine photo-lyase
MRAAAMTLGVIWFKRDLRVFDHQALVEAARNRKLLALYVYEPELVRAPDCAPQHIGFINECLAELDQALTGRGSPLQIQHGEITSVLKRVLDNFGTFTLYSHEETGNALSSARDLRVADWCREQGIRWKESPSNGVVRRLQEEEDWNAQWQQRMRKPPLPAPDFLGAPPGMLTPHGPMTPYQLGQNAADKPQRQHGGRKQALLLLKALLSEPSTTETGSRLSPYMSYGVLSVREVLHKVWKTRADMLVLPEATQSAALLGRLQSFEDSLRARCQFIQQLESEPALESHSVRHGSEIEREPKFNQAYFERWQQGETGFPLVDAAMKMLAATGWINFPLRALLINFSSCQLWNHWREPALHLAREFVDYEPGIHYPQVQLQSGLRDSHSQHFTNPIRLAQELDPQGEFVKRWLPQLAAVPTAYIFKPWTMPLVVQEESGVLIGRDYPAPVVDHLD